MAQHTVPANELAIKALRCPEGKGRRKPPVALTKVILDRDSLPPQRSIANERARRTRGSSNGYANAHGGRDRKLAE